MQRFMSVVTKWAL